MAESPLLRDPSDVLAVPPLGRNGPRASISTPAAGMRAARRQLLYEIASGASGAALAFFMWGHMMMVGTILTGQRGFDFVAQGLEHIYVAQPTVVAITALFLVHAVLASRKIPAQLRERHRMRRLASSIARPQLSEAGSPSFGRPHLESSLWIWQVRTGMIVLLFGSGHLLLVAVDLFTPLFGERVGIEAVSSMARVSGALLLPYAILLIAVEFHASVGLYRLAVKWGFGARLGRRTLHTIEQTILVAFLGLGLITLVVLAGWIEPPLAFLTEGWL